MGSTNILNDIPLAYCYRRNEPQVLELVNNLGKLFANQSLFDCSIICEGNQVIRGHKLMLSASSDYFKTAFTSFEGGNDHNNGHSVSHSCSNTAIIIREVPYHDLKLIIDYIYSGEMIIPAGQLSSIQKSCQWLKVNCLPATVISSPSSTTGLIPIKSLTKVNSNANGSSSNRIKIKTDATSTIKVNNGRLSINDNTLTNGHQSNINVSNSFNRVPSLLFPFRSTNQSHKQLLKIVDSSQLTDGGSKSVKTNSPSLTTTSSSPSPSSTSSLSLKIISSPNESRKVYSTSSISGESFVQLRELLCRDPNRPDSGNEENGNRNDATMISNQEEGGVEEEFNQMKNEDCNDDGGGDGDNRMDDDHGGEEVEREKMTKDDKQDELIVEEEVEGEGEVVIEEDGDEEGEEEEGEDDEKYNEFNNGQGQEVDNAGYLSSEEFEIDIPRSNELNQSDLIYHQKMEIPEENNLMPANEVEIEEEDDEEEDECGVRERTRIDRNDQRIEIGREPEDEGEEDEEDEEDEVIDMRVNNGRRFDHPSSHHHISHHPYAQSHHSLAAFKGQNLEAAAAAVAAVAAVAASTTGSTSATSNLMDECPSSDSLDLDCGDKLRATNYSMIPFTASIASSFNSATARAIAASTTLAVASGLLSKSQQMQSHSSPSSSSSSTTTTTTTTPGINGTHLNNLTNSSSSHQLLSHHHPSSSHPHQHHPHEIIYKTTSSNSDSHSDVSTVPLKRGRGRPPRHLRETPLNGLSATSHNSTSSPLEPFRTYKVRNILPSATTSDLILHSTNTNKNNNNTNKGNHNNQLNSETNNHQHHHLILSTSSNLGLTLKRKIRLNNNSGGLIGLVSGIGTSTKGRKPKLSTQSTDCSNNNNNGKNVCPFCPQVYYSNQAMNDHINNVHTGNSRKYTCDLCSKEFSWKISLTKHLRNSHKSPDKLTEQLTNNNLIDSRQQQQQQQQQQQ